MATPAEVIEQSMASGFDEGLQRRHQNQDFHRQTEWLDKHNDLVNEREAIRQRIYNLDPNSPTYAEDYAKGHQALTKTVQDYQDFLHPDKNPGAFEAVKHVLGLNIHPLRQVAPVVTTTPSAVTGLSTSSPSVDIPATPSYTPAALPSQRKEEPGVAASTLPATPDAPLPTLAADAPVSVHGPSGTVQQLKERAKKLKEANDEVERMLAGAPVSPEQQGQRQTRIDIARENAMKDSRVKWAQDHGASTDEINKMVDTISGIALEKYKPLTGSKPYKGADGRYYQSIQSSDGTISAEPMPADYTPPPVNGPKVGSFGDFMLAGYGPNPTAKEYTQGRRQWAEADASTVTGDHVVMVPQRDGSIVPVTIQTTSSKSFGSTPTPSATRRDQIAPPSPSGTPSASTTPRQIGATGGGTPRVTPSTVKDLKKHAETMRPTGGAGVKSVGDVIGGRLTAPQSAAKNELDDAVANMSMANTAQKNKEAGTDKVFLGSMQKLIEGRFNQGAYDNLSKKYGLENTFQGWLNSLSTGAFPPEVRNELVKAAKGNLEAKQAAYDFAMKPDQGGATPPAQGGRPSGATHKVLYQGTWYYADKDGNNLGAVTP